LPDTRHWYYSKNRWINYDDEEEMRELYPENFGVEETLTKGKTK